MNEAHVVEKLSVAKEIHLSEKKKALLKASILRQIEQKESRKKLFFSSSFFFVGMAVFIVFFVISFLFVFPRIQRFSPAVSAVRIAFASNHYEKTEIAFEEALQQFRNEHSTDGSSLAETMAATRLTNQYISKLHLGGEKGRYTAEQCKRLYQQYVGFLSLLHSEMSNTEQQQFAAEITQYQHAAHIRLAFYR